MKRHTYLIAGVAVVAAAVASAYVMGGYLWQHALPEGLIQANGRVEGDHVTVSSKFPGRVVELTAREGSTVVKGAVLIRLDDAQTKAKVDQAARFVDALMAQVEAAHTSLAVLNLEVPLNIETATAKVESARAAIQKAKAVEYEARRDIDRVRTLLVEQAVSQQQVDQAEARWKVAVTEISVAKAALDQANKELGQAELGWKRIRSKEGEVAALERQRDQADAALAEAESV